MGFPGIKELTDLHESTARVRDRRARRDMFIAAAITGMYAYPGSIGTYDAVAANAIAQADAVMAALELEERNNGRD